MPDDKALCDRISAVPGTICVPMVLLIDAKCRIQKAWRFTAAMEG